MPARLLIEGGVALKGEVAVSAAKNAALPALAAALLTARPLTLTNVPELGDVRTMLNLLATLGARVERRGREVTLTVERVTSDLAPYELVSTMRASVLVLGPLVARHGSARVALPGGCAIGVRPIDQHLKGLAKLGAEIVIENGYVVARARRLEGARISTDMVTVTGTENLMMAAALGLSARVTVVESDLFSALATGRADLIVANPPYLPAAVIATLAPEVSRFDPRLALDGGPDGLDVVRRLVADAPARLGAGGALLLETAGGEQARAVVALLRTVGFGGVQTRPDLAGVERFVAGRTR